MVLIMKYLVKIAFLLLFVILFSCDPAYYVDCDECFVEEPTECSVEVIVGSNSGGMPVFDIVIYLGKVEDDVVIGSYSATQNLTFNALIYNEYTVVATTRMGEKTYTVVNSVTPDTKLIEEVCSSDCYVITNRTVDARLKYY